jgi:hypothetical protein
VGCIIVIRDEVGRFNWAVHCNAAVCCPGFGVLQYLGGYIEIEERFRQSQSSRNQFTLPAIAHELSLEEELTEYTQMHGTAEFK